MGWTVEKWGDTGMPVTNYRMCIVRDVVKRFVSGYTNRVIFHAQTRNTPTFDDFVENFEDIRKTEGDINLHLAPQTDFIGKDPTFFSHVFNTEEFEEVFKFFEDVYSRKFPRFRLQQGGNNLGVVPTPKQAERIREYFKEDCDIWNL